jgi:hypothetical protein
MSAVGGFFQGLTQGIETSQKVRRNRSVEKLLDRRFDEYDLNRQGLSEQAVNEGGQAWEDMLETPDPFLIRGFNWLQDRFGGGQQTAAPSTTAPTPSAVPDEFYPEGYADGGMVEEEEELRGIGVPAATRQQAADLWEENAPGAFDDTAAARQRARGAIRSANAGFMEADNARDKGAAIRDAAGQTIIGAADVAYGAVKDTVWDNPLTQGVLGFLGFNGTRENRQPDPVTPAPERPEPAASGMAGQAVAIDDSFTQEPDSGVVADRAIQAATKATPGHPDNPDQQFDWAEVREAGGTQEEIPHVGVNDWVKYRKQHVQARLKQGVNATDAHKEVDELQMNGARTNLAQAQYLLQAGNGDAAALAARAAFQYFPNGSDVRFGVYDGANGPVLVGTGQNEGTGEQVGKPMVLNAERMAVMVENFSNPSAFRVWTKDWRDEEFKRREYSEVTKPEAESNARYRDRVGQAALNRSEADLIDARTDASGAGTGRKQSDLDRANAAFVEAVDLLSLDNEAEGDQLMDTMARVYQNNPGLQYPSAINFVRKLYREGGIGAVDQAMEELGY